MNSFVKADGRRVFEFLTADAALTRIFSGMLVKNMLLQVYFEFKVCVTLVASVRAVHRCGRLRRLPVRDNSHWVGWWCPWRQRLVC
jgi:hypothetical protein